MNDSRIVMGSDSRETQYNDRCDSGESFTNQYNDNYQKTFVNEKLKLIWSMTGLIKFKNIDYPTIINSIMNMSGASIEDKLSLIINIMKYSTNQINLEKNWDSIFDLFVGTIDSVGNLTSYIIEVKNGEQTNCGKEKYSHMEKPICSGVHLECVNCLDINAMSNHDENIAMKEMTNLIKAVISKDSKEGLSSVGGNIYVASINKSGEINKTINNDNVSF